MKQKRAKFTTVSLPTPLIDKIKEKIKGTGFTSVSAYVEYVLREIVTGEKTKEKSSDTDKVKAKLRALGYI